MTAALATIGHNGAPEPTPFELSETEIGDLFVEASNWLDGSGVKSEADATAVSKLLDMLRQAKERADERRKDEAEPHDKAKAEIQARYGALIGNTKSVKGKAILAMECCKKALAPWLQAEEGRKQAEAIAARKAADEAAERARAAFQAAPVTDLAGRIEAERLAGEAKQAEALAKDADKDKAAARGGARAVTLRTVYRAEITDRRAVLNWFAANRPDHLAGMLQTAVESLCAASVRNVPGVTYHEERVAR
jgi:hypothetical protein